MARKTSKPTIKEFNGQKFLRIPIKTHILSPDDSMDRVIEKYAKEKLEDGDWIVISESAVAIVQGRAIPTSEIKVGLLARLLWRFVRKVPYGIGLRNPYSMQCAINQTGRARIVFAALVGAITRLLGRKGDFYRLAGTQAAMIDAPTTSPVEQYKKCVIMGPEQPTRYASQLSRSLGYEVAIMDINDIGGSWVIGASNGIKSKLLEQIMRDNPLGQQDELTPLGLVRKVT